MIEIVPYIKNAFVLIGSSAGLLAFFRPLLESKFQRDIDKAKKILEKFNESEVMFLESAVYSARRVPESVLRPFDEIQHKHADNWQELRFAGPMKKYFKLELENIVATYIEFRNYVQVPEWEPREVSEPHHYDWMFNKNAFREGYEISDKYATHLEEATAVAAKLKKHFQRFQSLTEMHFFESFFGFFIIPRRFKSAKLE